MSLLVSHFLSLFLSHFFISLFLLDQKLFALHRLQPPSSSTQWLTAIFVQSFFPSFFLPSILLLLPFSHSNSQPVVGIFSWRKKSLDCLTHWLSERKKKERLREEGRKKREREKWRIEETVGTKKRLNGFRLNEAKTLALTFGLLFLSFFLSFSVQPLYSTVDHKIRYFFHSQVFEPRFLSILTSFSLHSPTTFLQQVKMRYDEGQDWLQTDSHPLFSFSLSSPSSFFHSKKVCIFVGRSSEETREVDLRVNELEVWWWK